ncbi:MAG: cohesin domain-containing protein [Schaedlerella sp.]|nr:cohesin domain-containing protein [Schaedlerella sp.]
MKHKFLCFLLAIGLIVNMFGTTTFATESTAETKTDSEIIYPLYPEDEVENATPMPMSRIGSTTIYKHNTGKNTIEDVLGCSRAEVLNTLEAHVNDTYYLTTPYVSGDHRNPNGDCYYNYGIDTYGVAAMNCTGFVWHVLTSSGGAKNSVPAMSGWVSLVKNNNIEYRTYVNSSSESDLIKTIIEDGYATPGDIIWTWDGSQYLDASSHLCLSGSSVHHVGIYIGDYFDYIHTTGKNWLSVSDSKDRWWHSTNYLASQKGFSGNQTTNISPITTCYAITVIKMSTEGAGTAPGTPAETPDTPVETPVSGVISFVPEKDTVKSGTEFTVDVVLESNPGIQSLIVDYAFDTEFMELVKVEDKGLLKGFTESPKDVNRLLWIAGDYTDDADNLANNTNTGTVATLTFKAGKCGETIELNTTNIEAFNVDEAEAAFTGNTATIKVEHNFVEGICTGCDALENPLIVINSESKEVEEKENLYKGEDKIAVVCLERGDYYGIENEQPMIEGYVFSGWFADAELSDVYSETEGTAYAKFVDENVLTTKVQISLVTESNPVRDIRFVTTVDTLHYNTVGFNIIIGEKEIVKSSGTVYEQIKVKDTGEILTLTPKLFSELSNYFLTYRLNNIPEEEYDTNLKAKAFWITLDGTKVLGAEKTFNIGDVINQTDKK